jgi:transcriptional regulator NrdR family protein
MKCPFCSDQESKVVDSRHSEDGLSIRRRRECLACQRRFTTYEIVESLPIIVTSILVSTAKLALIAGAVLLIKWLSRKFKKK